MSPLAALPLGAPRVAEASPLPATARDPGPPPVSTCLRRMCAPLSRPTTAKMPLAKRGNEPACARRPTGHCQARRARASVGGVRVGRRSVSRTDMRAPIASGLPSASLSSVHVSRVAHPDPCCSLRGLCESLCDSQHCIA